MATHSLKAKRSLLILCCLILTTSLAQAGLLDGVTKRVGKKLIDKIEDKAVDAISSEMEDKETGKNPRSLADSTASENAEPQLTDAAAPGAMLSWSKFDFLPGDKVIFEDGPSAEEENGEFPSRWDLKSGNVEIAEFNQETVIYFLEGSEIVPYLKHSEKAYLPEVFTFEFDCYFEAGVYNQGYKIYLHDQKNQRQIQSVSGPIHIWANAVEFKDSEMNYPGEDRSNRRDTPIWRHISIAYTKGKIKVYMDDTRLINIPHLDGTPIGITLGTRGEGSSRFVKNLRLAEGGVKYYDRVLQDGKIIVTGIKFDVNKSTLKPESMGPINEIAELMQKNPELRFSVEGHTDSNGEDGFNQKLSEERAQTVAKTLAGMGIASDRLSTKGWGESKPMDSNASAEGRANNRRVEFVKF